MQHKSLFAALLCGALCLTACLKNEESPSVTQVRNAKAAELESIAELNKAQATAVVTLANADAKLKEAQAKLLEADVKFREAEARKVDAETALLAVEAKLQEVMVDIAKVDLDIAKVELEAKQAELEALKAQYKAEIAAAEASEAYWKGMKEQVATEMEIMAAQLQAALLEAQKNALDAQNKYDELVQKIDEQLAENENKALWALRDSINSVSQKYTAASIELLDEKWDLYQANMMKSQFEAGILTLKDIKNQVELENNNEIARIERYLEYVESFKSLTQEEIKDQMVDAKIAWDNAYIDYTQAENKAQAEKDAWHELKTQIQYTFVNKFNNEKTKVGKNDLSLSSIAKMLEIDPVADEETGAMKYIFKYDEENEEGEVEEKEVLLYTAAVTEKTPFSYPELPEGIDKVSPRIMETMSDEERVIHPLTLNKEGYQTVVNLGIKGVENARDIKVAGLQKRIDFLQGFIDYYAAPVTEYTQQLEELEEEVKNTYDAIAPAREAWIEAMRVWGKENEVANMMEIQALIQDYLDAYDEAVEYERSFEYNGMTINSLERAIGRPSDEEQGIRATGLYYNIEWAEAYMNGTWNEEGYDGNNHSFDPSFTEFTPSVSNSIFRKYTYRELLVQLETAKQRLAAAKSEEATAQSNFTTADNALNGQKEIIKTKADAVESAVDALYQARKDAATDPTNTEKATAVEEAEGVYIEALQAYNDEVAKLNGDEGFQTKRDEAYETLQSKNRAVERAQNVADAYQAAVDFVVNGPATWQATIDEYQGVIDAYEAQIQEYFDTLNGFLNEWADLHDWFMKSESGEDALDAYDAYAEAVTAYEEAEEDRDAFVELYSHKYVFNAWAEYYGELFDDYANIYPEYPGEVPAEPEYPEEPDYPAEPEFEYDLDDFSSWDEYEAAWWEWYDTEYEPWVEECEDLYEDWSDAYDTYWDMYIDWYYDTYQPWAEAMEKWYYSQGRVLDKFFDEANLKNLDNLFLGYGFPESYYFYAEWDEIVEEYDEFWEEYYIILVDHNWAKFLSVANLKLISDRFDKVINGERGLKAGIESVNKKADEMIEEFNGIMDLYEDVTATESVYLEGVDELNEIWASYVNDKKDAFDKKLVLDDAVANYEALNDLLQNTKNIDEQIANAENTIAGLKAEIEFLKTAIDTSNDLLSKYIEPRIALDEERIAVLEALVDSLKAQLDELLAQLAPASNAE